MNQAEAKDYWESRFERGGVSLSTTGWLGLGSSFNDWMYRVRRVNFQRAMRKHLSTAHARVLDIGSGSGFYLRLWRELGIASITGSDFTDAAVSNLKEQGFKDIEKVDVTAPPRSVWERRFDIVSAMDVLYHIVDDAKYRQAFVTAAAFLRPGGLFVLSENCLHGHEAILGEHQTCRTLSSTQRCLEDAGFELLERKPVFYLLNTPIDSTSKLLRLSWRGIAKAARTQDALGFLVGASLFPLELALTNTLSEGPSTELLICRKR